MLGLFGKFEFSGSAMKSFKNVQVQFNLGRKWYPVHAFMAEYNVIMGIGNEMNLHSSVFTISKFIPVVTAEIEFVNHLPKHAQ